MTIVFDVSHSGNELLQQRLGFVVFRVQTDDVSIDGADDYTGHAAVAQEARTPILFGENW